MPEFRWGSSAGTAEERLVRLSLGPEDEPDLLADLARGLEPA